MNTPQSVIAKLGGVAHIATLATHGFTPARIQRGHREGALIRVRPGVYSTLESSDAVVRAARIGGRLAGESLAELFGLWTSPDHPLTVKVSRSASHLRDPDDAALSLDHARGDVRILWSPREMPLRTAIRPGSIQDAIREVLATEPLEIAIATIDSVLRRTGLSIFDIEEACASLPKNLRARLALLDGRSESGTESVLRVALHLDGVEARPQVHLPFSDFERFDLLVGDRLVIECDSEEHHGGADARLRDLKRDTMLACLGFVVLRFDYRQVFSDRETVLAAVRTYLRDGLHLRSMTDVAGDTLRFVQGTRA